MRTILVIALTANISLSVRANYLRDTIAGNSMSVAGERKSSDR
jgi:hypothetical protein